MEIDGSSWGASPFLILLRMPTRNERARSSFHDMLSTSFVHSPPLLNAPGYGAKVGSTKERFKVALQHGFQFTHERPPLSLLCLQDQQEDRFEELDTHRGAQAALCRREVWGTPLNAELKAGLQFLWQIMRETRHAQRGRGI